MTTARGGAVVAHQTHALEVGSSILPPATKFSFVLPAKAWSTNEDRNLNPYKRAELIKLWKEATYWSYKQAHKGKPLPYGIVHLSIPFTTNRRRDPHNYCGTVTKSVIDGLVMAGAWTDDTPEYVGHREPTLVKGTRVDVTIYHPGPTEPMDSRKS